MLNQSADYALRAVLYLAQRPPEEPCSAAEIARALGVPRNYMGKVLNTLARGGLLSSVVEHHRPTVLDQKCKHFSADANGPPVAPSDPSQPRPFVLRSGRQR